MSEDQGLHVLSFEVRRLRESTYELLGSAVIDAEDSVTAAERFRERLVWPLGDVAIIQKCNAVIVVATVLADADPGFVRDLLLDRWLEVAPDLGRVLPQISHYVGRRAFEYLGEVAVGLRSVVLGDTQVYAQVVSGLRTACSAGQQRSPFALIDHHLSGLLKSIRTATSLQEGNLSLERIAVERLLTELGGRRANIAIIGLGRIGRLLSEILTKETDHDLVVTNRTLPSNDSGLDPRLVVAPWGDLGFLDSVTAVLVCLNSTPETREYIEGILAKLTVQTNPLVIDMSSPSVTRHVSETYGNLVRLEELASVATSRLEARNREVNKAKEAVKGWARGVAGEVASATTHTRWPLPEVADPAERLARTHRLRAKVLDEARRFLAENGFQEVQTPCLIPDGTAGRTLRDTIRLDTDLALALDAHRIYETGPVWSPAAPWAPAPPHETSLLVGAIRDETALADLAELGEALVEDVIEATQSVVTRPVSRRLSYRTALALVQESGRSVTYGSALDYHLLRDIAEAVRLSTGERIVVVTDCPARKEEIDIARDPVTGLGRTFRVVLDGWQVASGQLSELDEELLRHRAALSGARGRPARPSAGAGPKPLAATFEVALDYLVARLLPQTGPSSNGFQKKFRE